MTLLAAVLASTIATPVLAVDESTLHFLFTNAESATTSIRVAITSASTPIRISIDHAVDRISITGHGWRLGSSGSAAFSGRITTVQAFPDLAPGIPQRTINHYDLPCLGVGPDPVVFTRLTGESGGVAISSEAPSDILPPSQAPTGRLNGPRGP
jgi:hypothetical protein